MKKADSSYDSVVKDLFQRDRPSLLLDRLTGGVRVRHMLDVEFSRVIERRTDSAFLLEDNSILHLEFQTGINRQ